VECRETGVVQVSKVEGRVGIIIFAERMGVENC
jgi:hypothetical protein